MGKLSFVSYVWKCVLGMEIFYVACRIYPYFLSEESKALHNKLWEVALPGFSMYSIGGLFLGAVYMGVMAVIVGVYMVWMHNSSIRK